MLTLPTILFSILAPMGGLIFLSRHRIALLLIFSCIVVFWLSAYTRWVLDLTMFVTLLLIIPISGVCSLGYALFLSYQQGPSTVTFRSTVVALGYCCVFWLSIVLCYQNKASLLGIDLFYVQSKSMVPTLLPGDIVLADTQAYRATPPSQGDIVFFQRDEQFKTYVKRVANIDSDKGVYLLGDNAKYSTDSRVFGFIPHSHIIAQAQWVILSQNHSGNIRKNRLGLRLVD